VGGEGSQLEGKESVLIMCTKKENLAEGDSGASKGKEGKRGVDVLRPPGGKKRKEADCWPPLIGAEKKKIPVREGRGGKKGGRDFIPGGG